MKFGCCASVKLYDKVAEAGFDYIEVPGGELAELTEEEFEAVKEHILAGPIPCTAVNAYAKAEPKMVGDECDDEKTRAYAAHIMARASQLGVKTVGIGAPGIRKLPEGYDSKKAWEQGRRFLEITAEEAEKFGITLLFESIHKYACQFVNHMDEAYRMVEELNLPNVKLVMDYYHMKPMGDDIFDVEKYMKYVAHLHYSGLGENWSRPQINEDNYDELVKIFASVKALGYDGTISNESDNSRFDEEGAKALEIMKRAYAASAKSLE